MKKKTKKAPENTSMSQPSAAASRTIGTTIGEKVSGPIVEQLAEAIVR